MDNPNTGLRLISAFEKMTSQNAQLGGSLSGWDSAMRHIITTFAIQDQSAVLSHMNEEMDDIDVSLSNNDVLRGKMPLWRDLLGRWRRALVHYGANLQHLATTAQLQISTASPDAAARERDNTTLGDVLGLQDELGATKARSENVFQAMMSTMSIVSSEKAIQEAASVTKVTQLAFFFIPLTFVSGIFGMNLNV